jgi:nickel-dependent lactate racemase
MTTLNLLYGDRPVQVSLPDANLLGVLEPRRPGQPPDESALVRKALAEPIGTPRLRDLAQPGQRVVIVTSDLTRPCPSERLLPQLLDELQAAGVPDSDMVVVLALGLHRPMTDVEMEAAVGTDVYRRVRVINHDPLDVVQLGTTSRGTPVEIARAVVEADQRVCVANLELHYFAGYSGGAKAILPGCASQATVRANHAMMVRPEAAAGRLKGNPVRTDLEEGAAMVGVDFVLNVVVDGQHRILGAVAGDVTAAHRQGCELVAQQGIVPIPQLADVVLASAGGHPKDLNLYQAQKALDNAAQAVCDGGIVILVAECGEGFGNQVFEAWLCEAHSADEVLARIQCDFVLGGHKAAAVASVLKRARVYLVSSMPQERVRGCGLVPFDNVHRALETALAQAGPRARIWVMPEGGSALPVLSPQ